MNAERMIYDDIKLAHEAVVARAKARLEKCNPAVRGAYEQFIPELAQPTNLPLQEIREFLTPRRLKEVSEESGVSYMALLAIVNGKRRSIQKTTEKKLTMYVNRTKSIEGIE